ncbi:MAG TPA: hypothetical protein VFN74_08070 [Chloroflexota bacterium]|nr:hypothetical protein [Chloroflexota bacterium]
MALMALANPAGALAVGGLLIALEGGALWGALLGGYGGIALKLRTDEAADRWCVVPLGGTDVLVAASAGARRDEIKRTMLRHGARCFLDEVAAA